MPVRIVLLPSARSDIQIAAKWYESKQKGLGKSFKLSLADSIEMLKDPMRAYGPYVSGLSRIFVTDFPYCIYFKSDESRKQLVIYAVLHEKQQRDEILPLRSNT